MSDRRWFHISVAGAGLAAISYFTPLLVWLLEQLGMGALTVWLNYFVIPLLLGFSGWAIFFWRRLQRARKP